MGICISGTKLTSNSIPFLTQCPNFTIIIKLRTEIYNYLKKAHNRHLACVKWTSDFQLFLRHLTIQELSCFAEAWLAIHCMLGLVSWESLKNLSANAGDVRDPDKRHRFDPWVEEIPWSRKWQSTPLFLPGDFHGQRSLLDYSLWGHKESDMTQLTHTHTHTHTLGTERV